MKLTKVLLSLGITFALSSCANAQTNIALNKKVTTSEPSNYALTKDKNPAQLVDGIYAGSKFNEAHKTSSLWVQKGSITWRARKDPIIITIDLGKTMPISGISYSTAAGAASVQFPSFAGIAVSDDGKSWSYQGDLIALSRKNAVPDLSKYTKHRFVTHDLKTKGRYVALAILQSPYTVTDEIEIYNGDNAWLNSPAGGEKLAKLDAATFQKIIESSVTQHFVQRRVAGDIKIIRTQIEQSKIPTARKSTFIARLDKATQDNEAFKLETKTLKTTLPISSTHRDVMAVYGDFLAAQNVPALTIWKQHRYAWTPFIAAPQTNAKPTLDISMLGNQFRSDALLITNASDSPQTVQLKIQNPPANAKEGWLKIDQAVWMDTYQGTPVTDALLPVNGQITLPAGFTGKIWLTVDSSKVPAGHYKSTFMVNGTSIPLNLNVSNITMQRPRMSLGVWDYTDPVSMKGSSSRGVTPENYAAALAMMKSHYVDSPWATRSILPFPQADDFGANNQLKSTLSFANFDKWVSQWPEARQYFIFVSVKENTTFAGAKRGTPEFEARVGSWAKALDQHMRTLKIDPAKLALLLVDEPGLRKKHDDDEWENELTADWARPIKASKSQISLISDPVWKRPDQVKMQEAFDLMDILMPNTQGYTVSPKEVPAYFQKQRAAGKDLWLYACIGPVRLFNPQQYYRGQAWRVFEMGGKGMGYWAFGDIGGAPTTWHDYQISRSFSPAFIDKDTVYNSIHWDATREGVEDFEELAMLRDAILSAPNNTLKSQAQSVLDEAIKTVTATRTNDFWHTETQPELVDQQLQKVRGMLEKLNTF